MISHPIIISSVATTGLIFDIIGALFVANEVVRVFQGPHTIDQRSGPLRLDSPGTKLIPNPDFEKHESKKRWIMILGLIFLLIGFTLQGIAAWLPIIFTA